MKISTLDQVSPLGRLYIGTGCIILGFIVVSISMGIISVDPSRIHVPVWVLSACGCVFIVAGSRVLLIGTVSSRISNIFGAILLALFCSIIGWIAFGSGPRVFAGGSVSPAIGRMVFGFGTILLFFLTSWATSMAYRDDPVEPEKSVEMPNWVIGLFLISVITEIVVLQTFLLPDGSWSIATPSFFIGSNHSTSEKGHRIQGYLLDSVWDFAFLHPRALALDRENAIYVGESYQGSGSHARILKFNHEGTLLGWWGKGNRTSGWHSADSDEVNVGNGDELGEFNYIFKIAFDQEGAMYVVDRGIYYDHGVNPVTVGPDRIDRYDRDGKFTGWFYGGSGNLWTTDISEKSRLGTGDNYLLSEPSCIILDEDHMLIGSWKKNRIDMFDRSSGKPIKWLGKSTDGTYGWHEDNAASLSAPFFGSEIGAFNGVIDCNLYENRLDIVSYNSNPVVALYDYPSGRYLRGLSHSDGHKPQELIEDAYGNLIYSDNYEGSIKFFDRDLTLVTKMQLGPGGDYFGVGDFAFDSIGRLYFIEQRKEKLYVLGLQYGDESLP